MKMTNTLTTFMLLASLCFSSFASAEDQAMPAVAKPSVLQEGTQRELSPAQIQELIPWAKNSKVFLNDLLNSLQGLGSADKLDRLEDGIKAVVSESAPKNSELLMRYVLNRGLIINNLLKVEMSSDEVGSSDTKLRVLISSVKMAITYYDTDMNTLTKKTNAPFITFGANYFSFLTELNKSIFDASASYHIQRTALEWLQWDLYRDLNNQQVASQIVKINNTLKMLPVKKMTDAQYIGNIKQMKLIAGQLDLSGVRVSKNEVEQDQDEENSYRPTNSSSNYISECSKIMSSDSYKTLCISRAKENRIAPELVSLCGKITSSDSYAYNCLDKMPSSFDQKTFNSYFMCSKIMSSDSYVLLCMDIVSTSQPQTIDIEECGNATSSDSQAYVCLQTVGENTNINNLSVLTRECGSIMSSDSYKNLCLNVAISARLETSDIRACKELDSDSHRYNCVQSVGNSGRMGDSADTILACSRIMSSDSYTNLCISAGLSKPHISTDDIRACGQMNSDSTKYTCLDNL